MAIALCMLAGCGADSSLNLNTNSPKCGGGSGPRVRGTVLMPRGRVAEVPTLWEHLASVVAAPVEALSGGIDPVGDGVVVQLVELRPEDIASGADPGVLETTTTNGRGEFCIGLREGTDEGVCRYVLQVGSRSAHTLTRAFVFGTDEAIDIDYRSEATVRLILAGSPRQSLCVFDPAEIRDVHAAVLDAPGTVEAADADEANAIATTLAADDPGVKAAVAAGAELPPTPLPTSTGAVPPTATHVPPTATHVPPTATRSVPVATSSVRPTRTPRPPTPTPTHSSGPTVTPTSATPPASTATVTSSPRPASPTASATAAQSTPTSTSTVLIPPTQTYTATPVPSTPTPTATVMSLPPLGERIFTIREDSKFPPSPPNDPRTGFFSSGLGGNSVSDKFSAGPLALEAGAPNANGVATLRLKQDAYFKINIPPAPTTLCVRMSAAGSSGTIDCDGGSAYGIRLEEPSGQSPPGTPMTGLGGDSGAGAVQLSVMQAIAEIGMFDKPCDATVNFGTPTTAIYTTATFTAKKGTAMVAKSGENFSCANWTMTDGPGMLVTGVVGFDSRAGGNAANATRLADN